MNVPAGDKSGRMWLPQTLGGLVTTAHTGASSRSPDSVAGTLYTWLIPGAQVSSGQKLEFFFEVGGVYAARVINPKDPRTVAPWSFSVQDTVRQRGSVTIMNNVISPRFGDQVTIAYSTTERGSVTILVSDANGSIVGVLQRGVQDPGDWAVKWDGKNRGGRAVAPGMYFVRIVGPGIDQTRKVLVSD